MVGGVRKLRKLAVLKKAEYIYTLILIYGKRVDRYRKDDVLSQNAKIGHKSKRDTMSVREENPSRVRSRHKHRHQHANTGKMRE